MFPNVFLWMIEVLLKFHILPLGQLEWMSYQHSHAFRWRKATQATQAGQCTQQNRIRHPYEPCQDTRYLILLTSPAHFQGKVLVLTHQTEVKQKCRQMNGSWQSWLAHGNICCRRNLWSLMGTLPMVGTCEPMVPMGVVPFRWNDQRGGLEERQPLGAHLCEAGGTYRHWGYRLRCDHGLGGVRMPWKIGDLMGP